MAEASTEASKKSKTEYTTVTTTDGREVQFAGKRKVNKDMLLDTSKIEIDAAIGIAQFSAGAVGIRMDFLNGDTRTIQLPLSLLAQFAGHGALQKFGDELAYTVKAGESAPTVEDFVLWIDDLNTVIQAGEWGRGRAEGGGGVSGASLVLQAILEVFNQRRAAGGKEPVTMQFVKDYIEKRLAAEATKPEDQRITRAALYKSFKNPATETGKVYLRLEAEKDAKSTKVDAAAEMEAMDAA